MKYLILFWVCAVLWNVAGDDIRFRVLLAASTLHQVVTHIERADFLEPRQ